MRTLIYEAPANHVLLEGGKRVQGGQEFRVSDERADQLLADTNVPVRERRKPVRRGADKAAEVAAETSGASPDTNPPEADGGEGPDSKSGGLNGS